MYKDVIIKDVLYKDEIILIYDIDNGDIIMFYDVE